MEENINLWARARETENFSSGLPTEYHSAEGYLDNRRCAVGVGFVFNSTTHKFTRHFMRCKMRSCPDCEPFWRGRQLTRLTEREKLLEMTCSKMTHYHQVLTTAAGIDKKRVYNAFRFFFQLFRKNIGKVEYFCSVEQNKLESQPHFHFLLAFEGERTYLSYSKIREYWEKAQKMAKFDRIANQTFTRRLDGDRIGWYMLKYLTKGGDKNYEIPTKEVWDGRHIRASKNFYPISVSVIDKTFHNAQVLEKPETSSYFEYKLLPSFHEACGSSLEFLKGCLGVIQVVKKSWDFELDRARSTLECSNTANAILTPNAPGFLNPMW